MKTSLSGHFERIQRQEIAARVRGERLLQVNEHFGGAHPRVLNARQRRRHKHHGKEERALIVKGCVYEERADPHPTQVSWLE